MGATAPCGVEPTPAAPCRLWAALIAEARCIDTPSSNMQVHTCMFTFRSSFSAVHRLTSLRCALAMEALMAQIKGFTALVASQTGLLAPETIARNMSGMVDSLDLQIRSLSLGHADAASINIAIAEGKFSQDHKTKLATSISERVSLAPDLDTGNKTQTLTNVLAYFTSADWLIFEDGTLHMSHKIGRITERCRLLGLCRPSEGTTKHLAAIVASTHCPDAQPAALHAIVVDIKKGLHNFSSTVTTKLTKYPKSPMELPQHIYDAAYAGEAPVVKKLDSFGAVAAKIPMRSSNHALTPPLSQNLGNVVEQLLVHLQAGQHYQGRRSPVQLTRYGESIVARGSASSGDIFGGGDGSPYHRLPSRFALQDDATSPPVGGTQGADRLHQSGAAYAAVPPATKPQVATQPSPATHPQVALDGGDEADTGADDIVRNLEALAAKTADDATKHGSTAKGGMKRPAAAFGNAAAKSGSKPNCGMKRPAAASAGDLAPAMKKRPAAMMVLGCAKCRGSPKGCAQCRDPGFVGRRFTRE